MNRILVYPRDGEEWGGFQTWRAIAGLVELVGMTPPSVTRVVIDMEPEKAIIAYELNREGKEAER